MLRHFRLDDMPALPTSSDESILNSYAEGILGNYTAEFTGALPVIRTVVLVAVMSAAAVY